MTVRGTAVSVGTTATLLTESGAPNGSNNIAYNQSFAITNNSTVVVYLGGPTVTVAAGLPLPAGQSITMDLINVQDEMYGVVSTGTADCRVLLTGWNGI